MASDIYRTILQRDLETFVKTFSEDAPKLFKTESGKLFHPGEYGHYREKVTKRILRAMLRPNVSISDGFVITKNNEISTQCDIIIYNSNLTPIISENYANMFPVEEVVAVGEVKSNLTRSEFIEALLKLAEIKKMQNDRINPIENKYFDWEEYSHMITFLICNRVDFDIKKIKYEDIYKNIERKYWHNTVLNIEQAEMLYALDFNQASKEYKEFLVKKNYILEELVAYSYPVHIRKNFGIVKTRQNYIFINEKDPFWHILQFFVHISKGVNFAWKYEYDFVEYLGLNTRPIFSS
ncbi:DUF6602 domain-containing protein [Treponema primitia]|uniref:DUF6602 domain-containing protein n=1 Tax=Treponema primitia TaxID=88058 RepID=UPI000307B6B0|nr:DUF6602 domain-containing protein [Treponema primitia]